MEDSADLVFFHPPYHNIIQYSGNMWGKPHPDDLSRCEDYNDFLEKLNLCIRKLYMALRKDGQTATSGNASGQPSMSTKTSTQPAGMAYTA